MRDRTVDDGRSALDQALAYLRRLGLLVPCTATPAVPNVFAAAVVARKPARGAKG
ncbi:MAG: hypothetical protein M3Y22_16780 [Pseudomonadota bacterium]|nr:hypothetical protein [Pseudomonadota bacterium]